MKRLIKSAVILSPTALSPSLYPFNTNMRTAKVDHRVIMKLMGHETPSVFNRYNTVDQEDAIGAMNRLNLFLPEQKSFESSSLVPGIGFVTNVTRTRHSCKENPPTPFNHPVSLLLTIKWIG
jgi:hypothetical protein